MNPTATKNILFVDFRDDAPRSLLDAIAGDNYTPPGAVVTPPSVRALERVTAAPFLLAAVLALVLTTGSAYVLASSFRRRRRDMAILRGLGSESRQMRAVVHWQASLAAAIIVVPGVALGVALGRRVVALLMDALGILPGADVRPLGIAAIVVAALLVATRWRCRPLGAPLVFISRSSPSTGETSLALDVLVQRPPPSSWT